MSRRNSGGLLQHILDWLRILLVILGAQPRGVDLAGTIRDFVLLVEHGAHVELGGLLADVGESEPAG